MWGRASWHDNMVWALTFFYFSNGRPYPLLRLRSTTNCRLSRLYMFHYVLRGGGVFRHQGLDRPPSLINLKRVDHAPGLFATPHSEVGNQERAFSVQYNTTSPSTCPPPESRSRPVIGDRFNTSGTPGN